MLTQASNLTRKRPALPLLLAHFVHCGGGEIRTHGPLTEALVFKTSALDHSATPPYSVIVMISKKTIGATKKLFCVQ